MAICVHGQGIKADVYPRCDGDPKQFSVGLVEALEGLVRHINFLLRVFA